MGELPPARQLARALRRDASRLVQGDLAGKTELPQ